VKYREVASAIEKKTPGKTRPGSEQNRWVIVDGVHRFRITYPKKHKGDIPPGTLRSIRSQSRLDRDQFSCFVVCTMTGTDYETHVRDLIDQGKI
jgi:hypothetical protein